MPIAVTRAVTLLQIFDMPTSIAFYRDVLGFEVAISTPGWALLRLTGVEIMLNTAYDPDVSRPAAADPARQAAHGDTIVYFDCTDVDGAFAELTAKGLAVPAPTLAPYGITQLCLTDPDGYVIVFQMKAELSA
jgi:glyoxylase I family protein